MSRPPMSVIPIDPPLGTIWQDKERSAEAESAGSLADGLSPYAGGLVRVRKQCRQCGRDFDGWMFVTHHQRRTAEIKRELAIVTEAGNQAEIQRVTALVTEPFHVGPYRTCPGCTAAVETAAEIAALNTKIERTRERWERAKTIGQRLPAARELARLLARLVGLLKFGSDECTKRGTQLDAIQAWITEHRVTETS